MKAGKDEVTVNVRVMLGDAEGYPIAGIGVVWLLKGIQKHRSINGAASDMKLSYPKALRILRNLENGLGQQLVTRNRGGRSGGGAELTPLGLDFIRRFSRMEEQIQRRAEQAFRKQFHRFRLHRSGG